MSEENTPTLSLHEVAALTPYPTEAFVFLRRALDYTVHARHDNPEELDEEERHVTGVQLCEGIRDFALQSYGMLASMMMQRWRIRRTEDFGRIVFAMVDAKLMQATANDTIHDFDNVYDFEDAFQCEIAVDHIDMEDNLLMIHGG